jgi:Amt family ammonium transporter
MALLPAASWAETAKPSLDTGDTAWMLASSALVLLMTPGLAMFYAGMVRAKNVLNTITQSFMAMALISVIWAICGYSLAFAPGTAWIGGLRWLGLVGVGPDPNPLYSATVPHQVFMVYQMMFAIITPALISGAIADRMKFSSYTIFIGAWCLLVYVPLAHMVWGDGGFLRNLGALDFAGGTVVHISSGVSALVLAILVGPRRRSMTEDMRPHNLPMTMIGTGLLWFGWFGFNAGSAIGSNGLAGSAFVATHLAAAAAGLAWVGIEWVVYRRPTALGLATGAVAGLVAVTPAAGFVGPMAAIVIGAFVSVISFAAIRAKERFRYDDALDVFGVHGVGGTWGALATGLFASLAVNPGGANGLLMGGGIAPVLRQCAGVGVAVALAVVGTLVIGLALKATIGLRVSDEEEDTGMDLSQHGEAGYAGPSTGSENGLGAGAPSPSTDNV